MLVKWHGILSALSCFILVLVSTLQMIDSFYSPSSPFGLVASMYSIPLLTLVIPIHSFAYPPSTSHVGINHTNLDSTDTRILAITLFFMTGRGR